MGAENVVLVGVAVVAIAAAVAAFAIAWRRSGSTPAGKDWRSGVDEETLASDRMRSIELPPVPVAPEPATETPAGEAEEPVAERAEEREPVAVEVATERRLVEVSSEEAGVTRRQFFNRAIGVTFGTFMGVLGLDFLAFLWPRLSGGFGADVNAGDVQSLLDQAFNDDGSVTPVFIPEARAYIVPSPSPVPEQFAGLKVDTGGVMALFQRCVHLGCRVPWCQPSQGFECPCHGSKYDGIGEYFAGPAPRNLDRFIVDQTGAGELIIKTGSIVQTPRSLQRAVTYPQGPSCIGGGA